MDPNTPQSPDQPADPTATGTPPPDGAASTPPAASPSDSAAPAEGGTLAAIPENAAGYTFNFSDKAQGLVGDLASDPLVAALQEHAATNKWPLSRFQDLAVAIEVAAEKGLIDAPIDNTAEMGKLGNDGLQRQAELESYFQALQARNDIDGEMFGEAMILSRTAPGVKMLEWFRKQLPDGGKIVPPTGEGGAGEGVTANQEKAREMARDERYGKDRAFTRQADEAWMKAFN
jgi:hypothetical protein